MNTENSYILVGWPESQKFIGKKGCVNSDDQSVFVPRDKYLKAQRSNEAAKDLLKRSSDIKDELLAFIDRNVPEKGLSVPKKHQDTGDTRVDYCDHFTGEVNRMTVTKIYKGRIEGVDDYGNEIERCSLSTDLTTDGIHDIVHYLVYMRNKHRM